MGHFVQASNTALFVGDKSCGGVIKFYLGDDMSYIRFANAYMGHNYQLCTSYHLVLKQHVYLKTLLIKRTVQHL